MKKASFQTVKDHVQAAIEKGVWSVGDLIASENELAAQFGVARMTVNRAMRELTDEGLLTRVQGAGTYVAPYKYQSTVVAIRSIADEVSARGHQYKAQVLALEKGIPPPLTAAELELPARKQAFVSRLIHFENDMPVQYEERWVNVAIAPEYGKQDFATITPNAYLMQAAPLQRVEYRIEAAIAQADVRKALAMRAGQAVLLLHRRTWSRGRVATVANLWHPGDRYQLAGQF
jgi:GntR family histidine utilization transcriptional repressor